MKAYSKINFGLKVGKRDNDGLHPIISLMVKINFYDELTILPASKFELHSSAPPYGEDNLVYKVVHEFYRRIGKPPRVKVILKKNVWIGSGLGGGSADAATALKMLNEFEGYPLNNRELLELGQQLGSDVPFFLNSNGLAIVLGKGETVLPLDAKFPFPYILLVNPGVEISTQTMYQMLDEFRISTGIESCLTFSDKDIIFLKDAIEKGDWHLWDWRNEFEPLLRMRYKVYDEIYEWLKSIGAEVVSITGTGAAMYGLFKKPPQFSVCSWRVQLTMPVYTGV